MIMFKPLICEKRRSTTRRSESSKSKLTGGPVYCFGAVPGTCCVKVGCAGCDGCGAAGGCAAWLDAGAGAGLAAGGGLTGGGSRAATGSVGTSAAAFAAACATVSTSRSSGPSVVVGGATMIAPPALGPSKTTARSRPSAPVRST
jgi:hypothetical protein